MTELNKENVCIGESSVAVFSQAYCETDIIVPDVNPDIAKILQVSTNAGIVNKNCSSDRITVDGRADIVVLYLGEDGNIYSIPSSQQFSHVIDAQGATDFMYTEAEINVDNIDYTILNTRKLNVKVLMGIDANAVCDAEKSICTNLTTDEPFEVLNKTLMPYRTASRATEQLCIRERLEVPAGKPSIEKILRMDTHIRDKSFSLTTNKMMVQGTLCVSTVYLSDVDGKIHTAEHEIPFAEVIALADADETMRPCLKMCVNKMFYKPEADMDGDYRFIMMEVIITANAKACYTYNLNVVQDAYCVKHPVKINRETAVVTKLVTENKSQISAKDVVIIPDDMPELMQIFNITSPPFLGTAKIEGKKAVIEGVIESDIMYISPEESCPITTYRHQQNFSHTVDLPQGGDNMVCDVQIDILHSSYTISMGREIDLRFVMEISLNVIANEQVEYITDIQCDGEGSYEPSKSYCIKIYFVKKGDSLWSIAKKHRIKKDALMEINNISSDSEMFDGRQIMIPIK